MVHSRSTPKFRISAVSGLSAIALTDACSLTVTFHDVLRRRPVLWSRGFPSSFDAPRKDGRQGNPLLDRLYREQAMGVAPVSLTPWSPATRRAAVQSAAVLTLGPRLLAGQAVPPLGSAPGCQSQALRLSRIPFHRVDPPFLVSPCPCRGG